MRREYEKRCYIHDIVVTYAVDNGIPSHLLRSASELSRVIGMLETSATARGK